LYQLTEVMDDKDTPVNSFSSQLDAVMTGIASLNEVPPLECASHQNTDCDRDIIDAVATAARDAMKAVSAAVEVEEKQAGVEVPVTDGFLFTDDDEPTAPREVQVEMAPITPILDVFRPPSPVLAASRDEMRLIMKWLRAVDRVQFAITNSTFYSTLPSSMPALWRSSSLPAQIMLHPPLARCRSQEKFQVYLTLNSLHAVPLGTFITVETTDENGDCARELMAVMSLNSMCVQLIGEDNCTALYVPRTPHAFEQSSRSPHCMFTKLHRNPDETRMVQMSIKTSKRALGLGRRAGRDPAELRWALNVVKPILLRGEGFQLRVDTAPAFSSSDEED
jgi:hypothetical protein